MAKEINSRNKYSMGNLIVLVQNLLQDFQNHELNILEAGCGSISKLKFSAKHIITGIDISQKQLDRNINIHKKVLGDIQQYKFPPSSFDMIICWHVLEHLSKPDRAVENFIYSLKHNGRIVIASPNPLSLKGLVTKFTPHWFHVFVYKYIYGRKDAGKDDQAPFKTYMRFSISPHRISQLAKLSNIETEYIGTHDAFNDWVGQTIREKSILFYTLLNLLNKTLKLLSLGKIGDSEFIILLKKN